MHPPLHLSCQVYVEDVALERLLGCRHHHHRCWLRVREVLGSIPSQGPRHTKCVIKMVPVVPLFSTEHSKRKILALSQVLR